MRIVNTKNFFDNMNVFPIANSNQITYEYFCLLGGLSNPRCAKQAVYNGKHFMHYTYHDISTR